jgi:hypothetical protein
MKPQKDEQIRNSPERTERKSVFPAATFVMNVGFEVLRAVAVKRRKREEGAETVRTPAATSLPHLRDRCSK